MSKVLEIVDLLYGEGQLYHKLMDFTLYFDRRITEWYFIFNVVAKQQHKNLEDLPAELKPLISEINVFNSPAFFEYCIKIIQYFIDLSIPLVFNNYPHRQQHLEKELGHDYDILINLPKVVVSQEMKHKILEKKQELDAFFIIYS